MRTTKKEAAPREKRCSLAQRFDTSPEADLNSGKLTTNRAKVYVTPMHKPRTTKVYSVSFPVWTVLSQWSNISIRGQTRTVSKTSTTVICDARDRIAVHHSTSVPASDIGDRSRVTAHPEGETQGRGVVNYQDALNQSNTNAVTECVLPMACSCRRTALPASVLMLDPRGHDFGRAGGRVDPGNISSTWAGRLR